MASATAIVAQENSPRSAQTLFSNMRQVLIKANNVSERHWGAPITEIVCRIPTMVYGGVHQSISCFSKPATFKQQNGPSLLLVPGLFCQPSVLNPLGRKLEKLGCDVYLPRSLPYFHGFLANAARVERSAKVILNDLEMLAIKKGVREITLVGHSLGGIISLLVAIRAKESSRVLPKIRGVILLSSPLRGSPFATVLRLLVPACRDLDSDSQILREVRSYIGTNCVIVSSGADLIVPLTSQEMRNTEVIRLDDFHHTDFYNGSDERITRGAHAIYDALTQKVLS
ncbi:MAG: hypothetical protein JW841_06340 [Deltaproteobacteria bacterium]|nr:hypothetical protein [Deltaproteobacteria bacterium]